MKLKTRNDMNASTLTPVSTSWRISMQFVLNLAGLIGGAAVALASLIGWGSPIGFFSGLAAAMYCLDGVR